MSQDFLAHIHYPLMSNDCSVKCLFYYLVSKGRSVERNLIEALLDYNGDQVSVRCFENALTDLGISHRLCKVQAKDLREVSHLPIFALVNSHYVYIDRIVEGIGYMYDPSLGKTRRMLNLQDGYVYIFLIDEK